MNKFVLISSFLIFPLIFAEVEDTNSAIRNLRAHYDAATDTITVDWEWRENEQKQLEDYELFVRYKVSSDGGDNWRRIGADEDGLGARIPLGRILNNGDELTVQVVAESRDADDGREADRSEPLVIWIARKSGGTANEEEEGGEENYGVANIPEEEELIPPFNFTANVLGAEQVQLEWRAPPIPGDANGQQPFYIVNVRQLSSNSGDRYPPQQIRVDANNFLLGNLVPGESYEFTIRTALSAERISSAAAIVEIALPKDDELVEVGNLIVTSKFRPDGHGVVNLTWEIPAHLRGKIRSYEMRYADAERARRNGPEFWELLLFSGHSPTTEIYDLKADTEYLLRIRTILSSGAQVESGEFRFRTPKLGGVNPLARLDVLYSSESPTVRLQWILAPHVQTSSIAGYDVYITERYDLPEGDWTHHRVDGRAPQLALDQLQSATTYFVRVDVRNQDGTTAKSNAVYRFTTLDNLPLSSSQNRLEFNRGESLAFQQIGRGRVQINWAFPEAVRLAAKGITIYYSSNSNEPMERWHRVLLENVETRSVILIGLRENILYNVQIVPTSLNGQSMWEHAQRLQLKTDENGEEQQQQQHDEEEEEAIQMQFEQNEDKLDGHHANEEHPLAPCCCYLPDHLPPELTACIFERLNNWQDVLRGQICSKKLCQILRTNSIRMARPPADFSISKCVDEKEQFCWKLELTRRNCGEKKRTEKNLCAFDWLEVDNLTLKGPFADGDLKLLMGKLKVGRQRRIHSITIENVSFKKNNSSMFGGLFMQRYCQRIHLKNCHFDEIFLSKLDDQLESLAQFQVENSGDLDANEALSDFSDWALNKFAWDLRYRIRRHPIPLLWDAPMPRGKDQGARKSFLHAICTFIENWLHNSDAPFFRIIIHHCPDHFPAQFIEECANQGISQMFLQFPSRAHCCAHIKGKYNRHKQQFQLFPLREVPSATASAICMARFFRDI